VSIRPANLPNNFIEISWPVGCGESVLESNAELTDAHGWAPVQSPPEVAENRYRVAIPASERMRWFRVRKS
jgi:hypothetical protein